jgi:hypothetical protein
VVKTGRTRFIEVDVVVGPNFALQTVVEQDRLRERIWRALYMPLDSAWPSICLARDSPLGLGPGANSHLPASIRLTPFGTSYIHGSPKKIAS